MAATRPDTDGNLPAARRQLADAISALIDPRPYLTDQGLQWLDSRYCDLRDALTAQRVGSSHKPGPKDPAWLAAIHLLKVIDRRAQTLEPAWPISDCDEYPTVQRLRQLDTRKWRPQDTELVTKIAADITKDAADIDALFAPSPKFLPDPCPSCHHSHARRLDDEGKPTRIPALAITDDGCRCNVCKEHWPLDRLMFLGRVLGYRIEGVIET
ncbi:DUF7341 domain-containing protein [Mycobacterium kansasii]